MTPVYDCTPQITDPLQLYASTLLGMLSCNWPALQAINDLQAYVLIQANLNAHILILAWYSVIHE